MSDNIKVVVKVRPLISREIEDEASFQWRVQNNTLHLLDQNGRESGQQYTFDKVYDQDTATCAVYDDIAKPIVEAAIAGFNGTIFAYGQTSSGKTYTMSGTEESPGIIPLAVLNLFEIIKTIPDRDFLVRVSYIEIYNETLRDLLNLEKKNIKVHDSLQGLKVDATEKVTGSPEEVLEAMKQGEANRQTGATNLNEESSRSHSIFQITIESREHAESDQEAGCVNVSQLNLVDLAGSERSGQTGATGIRFKEGTHINKSLSVLAMVIKQLSDNTNANKNNANKYINYRDSKLTRILQNSLGGNAKTSIICAITPASVEETISTLQFANRAKAIQNKPEVNLVANSATMIQGLTKQLCKLQAQLAEKKNLEVMLESKRNVEVDLQNQISTLKKLILNGFGQTSSMDMRSRKKQWPPPRRMTISTLHAIDENSVNTLPLVPKFCTPVLKYNPQVLGMQDFTPIQSTRELSSLSEETPRSVTPPTSPKGKKVSYADDIINLDSDDDKEDTKCSPYHDCYQSTKTPPCVLRKKAKLAEKDLKEIVELTTREKIYTPTVVELMEKLEKNTKLIAQLEDQVDTLSQESNDKESRICELTEQLSKTEAELKTVIDSKLNFESQCKEYDTKITDWEVSYETLEKKAKTREKELLLRLEELQVQKDQEVAKLSRTLDNFMDKSEEVSLVGIEDENRISNEDIKSQDSVADIQSYLENKTETITSLASTICGSNGKLAEMHNENVFLKATIDTLNKTVNEQKFSLDKYYKDVESYNTMINDLQTKLSNKKPFTEVKLDNSIIEIMVTNQDKFIANNENVQSLIKSFKIAIDTKNKEIDEYKSTICDNNDRNNALKNQIKEKEEQIFTLLEQVENLNHQINENTITINKLLEMEKQSQEELTEVRNINDFLRKQIDKNSSIIECLENNNKILTEKISAQQEISNKNEVLSKTIDELTAEVRALKYEIDLKEKQISSESYMQQNSLKNGKSIVDQIHGILQKLDAKTNKSRSLDSMETIFKVLEENFDILNDIFMSFITQKEQLSMQDDNQKGEIALLQAKNIELNNSVNALNTERQKISTYLSDLNNKATQILKRLNVTGVIQECANNEVYENIVISLDAIAENISLKAQDHKSNVDLEKLLVEARDQEAMITEDNLKVLPENKETTLLKQKILSALERTQAATNVLENAVNNPYMKTPQTLLSISLNKVANLCHSNNSMASSSSKEIFKARNVKTQIDTCKCFQLISELNLITNENLKLKHDMEKMKSANHELTREHDEIRKELQLLIEPANELQKKITNHKTNVSTLTATTYAENKLLYTQLKVLEHYHTRYINVCQRYIPAFKTQLHELLALIKSDRDNVSFKRYSLPDVFDSDASITNFKNESTLDGDLLMLDTNLTLTSANNTVVVNDDSLGTLDVTQLNFDNEVACQTSNFCSQLEILSRDNQQLFISLQEVKNENLKLKELATEVKYLTQELDLLKTDKDNLEKKYSILLLERHLSDSLVRKLNEVEQDCNAKEQELLKISSELALKKKHNKALLEENETLSMQVMDNISEAEDLRKKLDDLKLKNTVLANQCESLDLITSLQNQSSKLNRSLSDSESSITYKKYCTLQNELYASKQDCKNITREVSNIKNHLCGVEWKQCGDLTHDLDDSLVEPTIFNINKEINTKQKFSTSSVETYLKDKMECINYYKELCGDDKENIDVDLKIIDIMKMLYTKIVQNHKNEVENLQNELKIYDESKNKLQSQLDALTSEYTKLKIDLEEKATNLNSVQYFLSDLRKSYNIIHNEINNLNEADKNTKLVTMFKEDMLKILDKEFGLCFVGLFESIINMISCKEQSDLKCIMSKYTDLQNHMESVLAELNIVNDHLEQMKSQLSDRENEFNLLKAQKERVYEISNAVTLDLIRREHELSTIVKNGCSQLIECKVIGLNIDTALPLTQNLTCLFEHLSGKFTETCNDIEKYKLEVNELSSTLKRMESDFDKLKTEYSDKTNELQTLKSLNEELSKMHDIDTQRNLTKTDHINKLASEMITLKETIQNKEQIIKSLESHRNQLNEETIEKLYNLEAENNQLKSLNAIITEQKENLAAELQKTEEIIKNNKIELEKLTADILVLRENVVDNVSVIDGLKKEAQNLVNQNMVLKNQLEEKSHNCSRLEMNIKTIEKSSEIQARIISRLQSQKEEDDRKFIDKDNQIQKITNKCIELQHECDRMANEITTAKDELTKLTTFNEYAEVSLKKRILELESGVEGHQSRDSLDPFSENARRRRQTIYDSQRTFEEKVDIQDQNMVEALFQSRSKPDDLFTDNDQRTSTPSSTSRLSRDRDGSLARQDNSDKDISYMTTRRRRQSIHDQNRSVVQTLAHDITNGKLVRKDGTESDCKNNDISEVSELRERLAACQQELEDLKASYSELDDECETCAEYLRERDEQCSRLKRENNALKNQVAELKVNQNRSVLNTTTTFADASVNTDEDWANLHSVVVDRMSYNLEVEKNKKLTKTLEEMRYKKQELKKMLQKAMEKCNSNKDRKELETTKSELKACRQKLSELKEKYKELDEECEICGENLRASDEQVRRLIEAKAVLEARLQELTDNSSDVSISVRRKRRSLHDLNRRRHEDLVDATTDTSDILSYQVERDLHMTRDSEMNANQYQSLKVSLDKALIEKAELERQLMSLQPTLYVATGSAIVQNQQLTDLMKENKNLKKTISKLIQVCKKRGKSEVHEVLANQ